MAKQHVHKYRRIDIGRDKPYWVMSCSLPGCNHYTPMRTKLSCPSLVGKVSLCNSCGDRFVMDRRSLKLAKPTCTSCVISPKEKELEKAARFFSKLSGEVEDDLNGTSEN